MNWVSWALLSAAFAGATAVLAKVGVRDIDSNLATAVRTTFVLLFAWLVAAQSGPLSALAAITRRNWLFLGLSGLATALSWLCYFRALQLGDASRVAPVDKLSVVFVLVFAVAFLREAASLKTVAGAILVTFGVILLATK